MWPSFVKSVASSTSALGTIAPDTAISGDLANAIQKSGILRKFPEIDLKVNQIGVFGKLIRLDTSLRNLDRVEIYRPLIADPKEVRKQRAADEKVKK